MIAPMKLAGRSVRWSAAVILALTAGAPNGSAVARLDDRRSSPPPVEQTLVKEYCVGCHNQRLMTGGLALDTLDPENVAANAETWEKVLRKLQLGVMPPLGSRRPDQPAYANAIQSLADRLDRAAALHPNPGHPLLHRLNRAEYANAIRDLLGLDVDVTSLLPADDSAFGFDNVADVLNTSPALLQAYLAAARKISAVAVGDPRVGAGSETYTVGQDLSQDDQLDGLPLGTVGGLSARHTFPVDGEYDIQIKLYRTNLNAMRGLQAPHELELTLDGQRILLARLGGDEDLVAVQKNPTAASDDIETTRLRLRLFVKGGRHQLDECVSRRDVAASRDESPPAVRPRLQSLRCGRRASRPIHHRQGTVQSLDNLESGRRTAVCVPANGRGR